MSIKLMTAVWERQDLSPTQKLVMLALADWANDEGLCWPSIEKLCNKSSLSRRTVQVAIRGLCDMGVLIQEQVSGRGCKYWVQIGVQQMHPCSNRTPEAQELHPRGAADAPNTSKTHQLTTKDIIGPPDWMPIDAWDGWLEMRKARKKPLTERAMARAINKLDAMRQAGQDIAEVLDRSTINGWTDVYEIKEQKNGKRVNAQSADGLSSTARAALSVFGEL